MTQQEFFERYKYSIRTDRIGGGSFGTVYKAYDEVLNREVAIKVSEVKIIGNKEFSLKDEFEAIRNIPAHRNVANYEELHTYEGPQGMFDYAVMQFYKDGNLSDTIKSGMSYAQKEKVAIDLLHGIIHLHKHNVVHRDLKPGNILIVKRGDEIIPKITDFGLSKKVENNEQSRFSNSFGGGTLKYSSPEQLRGEELRLNTDLWSYGVIVHQIFTGKDLFYAKTQSSGSADAEEEIFRQIKSKDISADLAQLPAKWEKVAWLCLERNPAIRVKSAEDLLEILHDKTTTTKTPPTFYNSQGSDKTKIEIKNDEQTKHLVDDKTIAEKTETETKDKKKQGTKKEPLPKNKKNKFLIPSLIFCVLLAVVLFVWQPWKNSNKTLNSKLTVVSNNGKYGFVNEVNDTIIPLIYDYANGFYNNLARVKKADKYGFVNKSGVEIIPIIYDWPGLFIDDNSIMIMKNSKWGFIDTLGNEKIPFIYESAKKYSNKLAVVKRDGKTGLTDMDGSLIIPLEYEFIGELSEGYAFFGKNGKQGYLDSLGNEVIPNYYQSAFEFANGIARVKSNDKYGCINKQGEVVIPFEYDWIPEFEDGIGWADIGDKRGLIDSKGNRITSFIYDEKVYIYEFYDELATFKKNNKYGYINKYGVEVVPAIYDYGYNFSEGLASVEKNNKKGYIDKNGNIQIPIMYAFSFEFSEGLALVGKASGEAGYINKYNEIVIPFDYYLCSNFHNGYAVVSKKMENSNKILFGVINKNGDEVVDLSYDWMNQYVGFENGLASVTKNDMCGFIDTSGIIVIPLIYDKVWEFDEGVAMVEVKAERYFIDTNNNRYISEEEARIVMNDIYY